MQDSKGHGKGQDLPMGSLTYTAPTAARKFFTSLKLFLAPPWRKFKKGSVLVIEVNKFLLAVHPEVNMCRSGQSPPAMHILHCIKQL